MEKQLESKKNNKMKLRFLSIIFILLLSFFFISSSVLAQEAINIETVSPQEEILEAKVVDVLEEKEIEAMGKNQIYQKLKLIVIKGSLKDQEIIVESGDLPLIGVKHFQVGDEVIVNYSKDLENNQFFYITDYLRRSSLFILFLIFIFSVLLIGRVRGVNSLLAMAVSFFIIFSFILPNILLGKDPIQIAVIGSLFIIPITFYLSHGFNKKTTVAITGTIIALIITAILAGIFVESARLTGFAAEEAAFLQNIKQGTINIKGLLLAGIIIGVLGVLDDITISQSAIIFQLKKANKNLTLKKLYQRAMDVGQDHISSMVNTLVLVYTGASLPLLLLFINNPHPVSEIINYEIIADEVIRTLVGSIGLVLAVPITTLIAAYLAAKE